MTLKNNIKLSLMILIVMSTISVYYSGCTGETTATDTNYKTYEMKADDIRLLYCNHPLFSFEYPEVFILADVNKYLHGGFYHDRSEVGFGYYKSDLPYRHLDVTIYKPSPYKYQWENANELREPTIRANPIRG